MERKRLGFNTIIPDFNCPGCGEPIHSGIGFRVGKIARLSYKVGDKLSWDGSNCRPEKRPDKGNLKTIGYYNCDNPKCETWQDCFPLVQEVLIDIREDVIHEVKPTTHKPLEQTFDIIEPEGNDY